MTFKFNLWTNSAVQAQVSFQSHILRPQGEYVQTGIVKEDVSQVVGHKSNSGKKLKTWNQWVSSTLRTKFSFKTGGQTLAWSKEQSYFTYRDYKDGHLTEISEERLGEAAP